MKHPPSSPPPPRRLNPFSDTPRRMHYSKLLV